MAKRSKKDTTKEEVKVVGKVVTLTRAAKDKITDTILEEYGDMITTPVDRTKDLFKLFIPSLNHALGGGLPRGQMIHLYGAQGAGKSTMAIQITQAVQSAGGRVLYIDPENTVHLPYLEQLGVDISPAKLTFVGKPGSAERVLDMIEKMVRNDGYDLVVVDTVAALAPAEILESSNEDAHMAIQARLFSMALMKLNNAAVNSGTIILFVNQTRANISPMPNAPKTTTPGGNALKYYANIELAMNRIGSVLDGPTNIIGQQVKIKIMKNKIAPPMREAICNLIYGEGFRRDVDLIIAAKEKGIITQAGAYYGYGEQKWQGLNAVKSYAKEHPDFLDELEQKLYGSTSEESAKSKVDEPDKEAAGETAE